MTPVNPAVLSKAADVGAERSALQRQDACCSATCMRGDPGWVLF